MNKLCAGPSFLQLYPRSDASDVAADDWEAAAGADRLLEEAWMMDERGGGRLLVVGSVHGREVRQFPTVEIGAALQSPKRAFFLFSFQLAELRLRLTALRSKQRTRPEGKCSPRRSYMGASFL